MSRKFIALIQHHLKWGIRSWIFTSYFLGLMFGLGVATLVDMGQCRQTVQYARAIISLHQKSITSFHKLHENQNLVVLQPDTCLPGGYLPGFHGLSLVTRSNHLPWVEIGESDEIKNTLSFPEVFKIIVGLAGLILGVGSFVLMRQDKTLVMLEGNGFALPLIWLSVVVARFILALLAYLWTIFFLIFEVALYEGGLVFSLKQMSSWMILLGGGAVYLFVWVALGMAISALARSWEQALIIGIFVWSGLLWVLPTLSFTCASFLNPTPSPYDLVREAIEGRNRIQIAIQKGVRIQQIPSCQKPAEPMSQEQLQQRLMQCQKDLNDKSKALTNRLFSEYRRFLSQSYAQYLGKWKAWWHVGRLLAIVSPAFLWDEYHRTWNGVTAPNLTANLSFILTHPGIAIASSLMWPRSTTDLLAIALQFFLQLGIWLGLGWFFLYKGRAGR